MAASPVSFFKGVGCFLKGIKKEKKKKRTETSRLNICLIKMSLTTK